MRVALIALLVDQQLLCLRRSMINPVAPSMWELPGGKVMGIETTKEAAIRELEEETGIKHLSLESLGYLSKHQKPTGMTVELFVGTLLEWPMIRLHLDEHDAYQMIDFMNVSFDDQWLKTMDEAVEKIKKWRN